LGRETNLEDRKLDTIIRLLTVPKWQLYKAKGALAEHRSAGAMIGAWVEASGTIPPIGQVGSDLIKDVVDAESGTLEKRPYSGGKLKIWGMPVEDVPFLGEFSEGSDWIYVKARIWRYFPLIGKDVFWQLGKGREIELKRHAMPPPPKDKPKIGTYGKSTGAYGK